MCHSVPDSFLVRIASIEYVHIHRSCHLKLLKLHVIRSHFITFPTPTTQNYKIGGYIQVQVQVHAWIVQNFK